MSAWQDDISMFPRDSSDSMVSESKRCHKLIRQLQVTSERMTQMMSYLAAVNPEVYSEPETYVHGQLITIFRQVEAMYELWIHRHERPDPS